ncbi:MAG: alpha/beta hydrolase [Actinomycetaceae bacterium]|nr:alpha/beta hydrolase [Actinomycetaceae bacterium]
MATRTSFRRPTVVIAVVVTFSLLALLMWTGVRVSQQMLSAGSGTAHGDIAPTVGVPGNPPEVERTLQGYQSQKLEWTQCDLQTVMGQHKEAPKDPHNYECVSFRAPLNWDDLSGQSIVMTMAVHRSGKENAPALFYNLGGPGSSTVSTLVNRATAGMGNAITSSHDVYALDPRGVGLSTPLNCLTDAERESRNKGEWGFTTAQDATPGEIIALSRAYNHVYAKRCQEQTGDLFKHVDTISAAKDFELARHLIGKDKIDYLGYSYGTFLGATYADLYPNRVGRFILDGALDPTVPVNELSDMQMEGFDAELLHWIQDCQTAADCPFKGSVDEAAEQYKAFLEGLAERPLKTKDPERPLTQRQAITATLGTLYSTKSYKALRDAMKLAIGANDGSAMLFLADHFDGRKADGTFHNTGEDALTVVNARDFPAPTGVDWEAKSTKMKEKLKVFDNFQGYTGSGSAAWPVKGNPRKPLHAKGAPPIVVIGTKYDPATPYKMSQALADQLESGVLVTYDGHGHGAYSPTESPCIAQAVEGYLADGVVPKDQLVCSD